VARFVPAKRHILAPYAAPRSAILTVMAPTPTNLRLRLPTALAEHVREQANLNGVSINTLLVALVAGSIGFDLRPDPEANDDPQEEGIG
jgi:hypothetical protein